MPTSRDFSPGSVSNNILMALAKTNLAALANLHRNDCFYNNLYNYTSLRCVCLDDYGQASGYSLRFFLLGSEEAPASYLTKADNYLIRILNALPKEQLVLLEGVCREYFHSHLMDVPLMYAPSKKLRVAMKPKKGSGFPASIPEGHAFRYRRDIMQEVQRFMKGKLSNCSVFRSDYYLDLATMAGVSVRWLLDVKNLIFHCDSVEADNVFDLYALMGPCDKFTFLLYVNSLIPTPDPELAALLERGELLYAP